MQTEIETLMGRHRRTRGRLMLLAALMLAAIPAGALLAQAGAERAPYTIAESGRTFTSLQEAVNALGEGGGTIVIAPGTYRDCAVQPYGDVAFVAQVPGQTIFDGAICEGKGALVVRGRSTRVEGIVFQNQRVPDGNGAGIRLEKGDLIVRQSWFRDSEQGILSANYTPGSVLIEKSTFSRLGRCDRGLSCAHAVYFGDYGSVVIRRSRFEEGTGGHYVKSHAGHIEVTDCSFDDARGHGTNYMIDLSIGASGRIANNWFVQGRDKENYGAFIANAAEGHGHSAAGLVIEGNTARLAPGVDRTTAFVADWSGDGIRIGPNTLGPGLVKYERR